MREINVSEITDNIKEMCIQANHYLSDDMKNCLTNAIETEDGELGKKVLDSLSENLKIAGEDMIPICQDTGMAIIFIKIGQDVHFVGGSLEDAINEGVRRGYVDGYLRKSVVKDPILRENTKDNTPAIIHYEVVQGDKVEITLAPKGFGSENMSRVFMLKPADGIEGVKTKRAYYDLQKKYFLLFASPKNSLYALMYQSYFFSLHKLVSHTPSKYIPINK